MHTIKARQTGSSLIISLIILIVMTLLGLTAMGTSGLQERMAGNTRDMGIAFQAAEAALRDAENYFEDEITNPSAVFGALPGHIRIEEESDRPDLFDTEWFNANSIPYSGNIPTVARQPSYILEWTVGADADAGGGPRSIGEYGSTSGDGSGDLRPVRITARGVGGSEDTVIYLQSNYRKRF